MAALKSTTYVESCSDEFGTSPTKGHRGESMEDMCYASVLLEIAFNQSEHECQPDADTRVTDVTDGTCNRWHRLPFNVVESAASAIQYIERLSSRINKSNIEQECAFAGPKSILKYITHLSVLWLCI